MQHSKISEEDISRLEEYVGHEVKLCITTCAYIDPLVAPKGAAALRDDWDQYGGYPGYEKESSKLVTMTFDAVLGYEDGGKLYATHIKGIESGKEACYPLKMGLITYVASVSGDEGILWRTDMRGRLLLEELPDKPLSELVQLVPTYNGGISRTLEANKNGAW